MLCFGTNWGEIVQIGSSLCLAKCGCACGTGQQKRAKVFPI